jgi:hypothetical protein
MGRLNFKAPLLKDIKITAEDWKDKIMKYAKNASILLWVLNEERGVSYKEMKNFIESEYPVPSQIVRVETINKGTYKL